MWCHLYLYLMSTLIWGVKKICKVFDTCKPSGCSPAWTEKTEHWSPVWDHNTTIYSNIYSCNWTELNLSSVQLDLIQFNQYVYFRPFITQCYPVHFLLRVLINCRFVNKCLAKNLSLGFSLVFSPTVLLMQSEVEQPFSEQSHYSPSQQKGIIQPTLAALRWRMRMLKLWGWWQSTRTFVFYCYEDTERSLWQAALIYNTDLPAQKQTLWTELASYT